MLIVLWLSLAIVKIHNHGVRAVLTNQPTDGPSIQPILIVSAVLAGVLWGVGLG